MYINSLTAGVLNDALDRVDVREGEYLVILGTERETKLLPSAIELVRERNLQCYGALFPEVIYNNCSFQTGAVISVMSLVSKPIIIPNLNNASESLDLVSNSVINLQAKTAIVYVDGLSPFVADFLKELYNKLGRSVSYIGGGAGSLSLQQQPCIFNEENIYQDAGVIALLSDSVRLGVKHGWQTIHGPFVATKTDKNKIIELNWEEAFPLYKKIIQEETKNEISRENFFAIAKSFPFGMMKASTENIVRDPIMVGELNELICVGEVPENTVLEILKGDKESLINAATEAAKEAAKGDEVISYSPLVIDCISRTLFLEELFEEELNHVYTELQLRTKGEVPIIGALTLGEISSYGDGYLEFFNKTTVVGVFYE